MLAIDLSALIDFNCNIQSKGLIVVVHFHYLSTLTWLSIICRNPNISFAICHSMHASLQHPLQDCLLSLDPNNVMNQSF